MSVPVSSVTAMRYPAVRESVTCRITWALDGVDARTAARMSKTLPLAPEMLMRVMFMDAPVDNAYLCVGLAKLTGWRHEGPLTREAEANELSVSKDHTP